MAFWYIYKSLCSKTCNLIQSFVHIREYQKINKDFNIFRHTFEPCKYLSS
jgi:hypothetical protein